MGVFRQNYISVVSNELNINRFRPTRVFLSQVSSQNVELACRNEFDIV